MNWARIDTRIADHPKVAPLPEAIQWAYVKVILWCREWDTDGIVPESVPFRTFTRLRPEEARRKLVDAGLLIETNGALHVPNFCTKQPPSDKEQRTRWANNKRRQRARESQTIPNVPVDVTETSTPMSTPSPRLTVRNGTVRTPPPTPSRTDTDLERLDPSDFPVPRRPS